MDKNKADKLICEYRDKIFGFALSKLHNYTQAEELASDIICEVYISLLRSDDILNINAYVYRIACNVYSKYIKKLSNGKYFECTDNIVLPYYEKAFEECDYEERISNLRREIGLLSSRQRSIVYMHYYEKKSVSDIAKTLDISLGTVKWHLSDARNTLKEELKMNNIRDFEINPIFFYSCGHSGNPGSTGDTHDMFDTRLKQNIAWACYHAPKTIEEIARAVGVPIVYVADELKKLVEYAYIDKLDDSKNPQYRTNMIITDTRRKYSKDHLYKEAAVFLCEKYFPDVFEDFENDPQHWGYTCADNDINFLKYNLVLACIHNFSVLYDSGINMDKYRVKRPDGGWFVAFASVSDDCRQQETDENPYWICGYMTRSFDEPDQHNCLQLDSRFSSRNGGWRDNLSSDWVSLTRYLLHGSDKNSIEPEEYKRLCDKGYIHNEKVTVATVRGKNDDMSVLVKEKGAASAELVEFEKMIDTKCIESIRGEYPEHIFEIVKTANTGILSDGRLIPFVIEELLQREMLLPLNEIQKKAVMTILIY